MEHELEITLKWENTVGFKAEVKEDGGRTYTILEADENSEISTVWRFYSQAVESYVKNKLIKIGKEMAQE